MEFLCLWQILLVWSHWAWGRGKFLQTRSAPPRSTTPTGPLNAHVSITRRTAGRPQMTPSESGYRSVSFGCVKSQGTNFHGEFLRSNWVRKMKLCHILVLILESDLKMCVALLTHSWRNGAHCELDYTAEILLTSG